MNITIVCPSLRAATGNTSTVHRIQGHLNSAGITCLLQDVKILAKNSRGCIRKSMHRFVAENEITGVLLLHAFKCANVVLCKCMDDPCPSLPVPCCFIFGGTDLNVDVHDKEKLTLMQNALRLASCAVAFTQDMKQIAQEISPSLGILVYPQAVEVPKLAVETSVRALPCTTEKFKLFILVTSIRPVKDPLFILDSWMKLCTIYKDLHLKLLIIGPILDESYWTIFSEHIRCLKEKYQYHATRSPGQKMIFDRVTAWLHEKNSFPILYSHPLPSEIYDSVLTTHAFASINSSISEGMSSAVLESMARGVPVIARKVPGNCAVVTESKTGLLFDTPEKFYEQAERLLLEPALRDIIIKNALDYVSIHHSVKKEKQFYVNMCLQYLNRLTDS